MTSHMYCNTEDMFQLPAPHQNRARANTSDSSSNSSTGSCGSGGLKVSRSSSSTTIGIPIAAPPTRRRSHRPRGCRGGRKNRKSQQAKAAALIPKEILEAPGPLAPRTGVHNSNKMQSAPRKGAAQSVDQDLRKGRQDPTSNNSDSMGMIWSNQWENRPKPPSQQKIWSHSGEDNGGLPFMNNGSSFYSSRVPFSSYRPMTGTPAPPTALPHDILPPLSTRWQGQSAIGGSDPNATRLVQQSLSTVSQPGNLKNRRPPLFVNSLQPLETFSVEGGPTINTSSDSNKRNHFEGDYRNQQQRIQKNQIANTNIGGCSSLFVTSPRSFLLGGPSGIAAQCGEQQPQIHKATANKAPW